MIMIDGLNRKHRSSPSSHLHHQASDEWKLHGNSRKKKQKYSMFTCDVKSAGVSSLVFVYFLDPPSQQHATPPLDYKSFPASDICRERSLKGFIATRKEYQTNKYAQGGKSTFELSCNRS